MTHQYEATIRWTGNKGNGTAHYTAYERAHKVCIEGKPDIEGSSDSAFRGDPSKHNPEELLISSVAACHMLWYLHLCAEAGVVVNHYEDRATGTMQLAANGGGRFTEITLHPFVKVTQPEMVSQALALHAKANQLCFIANSVNFPVSHRPTVSAS